MRANEIGFHIVQRGKREMEAIMYIHIRIQRNIYTCVYVYTFVCFCEMFLRLLFYNNKCTLNATWETILLFLLWFLMTEFVLRQLSALLFLLLKVTWFNGMMIRRCMKFLGQEISGCNAICIAVANKDFH